MADTLVHDQARILSNVVPTAPAAPTSGAPALFGQVPGVCLNDAGDGGNDAGAVDLDTGGVHRLSVTGNDGAPAAIDAGDIVYANASTGALSSNSAGVRFGYALDDVASGATTAIRVKVGY